MDLGQLITNDHANITDLGSAILRGLASGVVRSRERLFGELDGAIRRHMEAEEESLYDALEGALSLANARDVCWHRGQTHVR
jgi:hypothetical protein